MLACHKSEFESMQFLNIRNGGGRRFFSSAVLLGSLMFGSVLFVGAVANAQQNRLPKLILDCDTANEQDDFYAIIRMLHQDQFDVLALNSTQWIHYLAEANSLEASQRDNEAILEQLGRTDLPALRGSVEPMGKPWGGFEPKESEAARFIVETAKSLPEEESLYVVCTGATTNLASAIAMAPEIAPRVKLYLMGFKYDFDSGVWNKSSFNVRRDLNAADFVLNQAELEVHIMPWTLARSYLYDRDDTFARLENAGELGQFLIGKWNARFADSGKWTMWDVALVQAMLRPDLVHERQVDTPPENTARKVWMYDSLDADALREEFWKNFPFDREN